MSSGGDVCTLRRLRHPSCSPGGCTKSRAADRCANASTSFRHRMTTGQGDATLRVTGKAYEGRAPCHSEGRPIPREFLCSRRQCTSGPTVWLRTIAAPRVTYRKRFVPLPISRAGGFPLADTNAVKRNEAGCGSLPHHQLPERVVGMVVTSATQPISRRKRLVFQRRQQQRLHRGFRRVAAPPQRG